MPIGKRTNKGDGGHLSQVAGVIDGLYFGKPRPLVRPLQGRNGEVRITKERTIMVDEKEIERQLAEQQEVATDE